MVSPCVSQTEGAGQIALDTMVQRGGRARPEERCAHRAWHTLNPDTDCCSEEPLAWSDEVQLESSAEEVQGGDPGSSSALCREV